MLDRDAALTGPAAPEEPSGHQPASKPTRLRRQRPCAERVVRGLSARPKAPAPCACCGGVAALARSEKRAQCELLVPYCEACLAHLGVPMTRDVAAALASCLGGVTLALSLPYLWGGVPLLVHWAATALVALLPPVGRHLLPERTRPGHTCTERAAWWIDETTLACTLPRFADDLARVNGGELHVETSRPPRGARWLWVGVVASVVIAPLAWHVHRPWIRVLNLTPERIALVVDGQHIATAEPTSAESPAAGIELRLTAGAHRLEAVSARGAVVHQADVVVRIGRKHLYAPGSDGTCFWLEETHYGRVPSAPRIEALTGPKRFWALPDPIDSWFLPNPAPDPADQRSTGGVLRALRQAPCRQAPAGVEGADELEIRGQ